MKIKGHKTLPLPTKTEVFVRDEGAFEIKVIAVPSYEEFNELVPPPLVPFKQDPQGNRTMMPESPAYQAKLAQHLTYQSQWSLLKGLSDNPDIEWENVVLTDPTTWKYVETELREWLLPTEWMRLTNAWLEVNGMSAEKIREARDNFLSGQLRNLQDLRQSPNADEQPSTVSIEPVSGTESSLPTLPQNGTTVAQ